MIALLTALGRLQIKSEDYAIVHKWTGLDELQFTIDIHDELYQHISEEMRIYESTEGQTYLVKSIDGGQSYADVVAQLDLDDWKQTVYIGYKNNVSAIGTTLSAIIPDGWTLVNPAGITQRRGVTMDGPTPLQIALQCEDTYGCAIRFDNAAKTATILYPGKVTNGGMFYADSTNMRKVPEYKGKSTELITRLYPIGKDGLSIADVNNGKAYVENCSYKNEIICAIWKDERYEDAESLLADAQAMLTSLSIPAREWRLDTVDLYRVDPEKWPGMQAALFDVCTVIDHVRNIQFEAQITEELVRPYMPEKNEVVLEHIGGTIAKNGRRVSELSNPNSPVNQRFNARFAGLTEIVNAANLSVENLTAEFTAIDTLVADHIEASGSKIGTLDAQVANIHTVLSGSVGTGELITIRLTAENVSIADAIIKDAMIADLSASKLTAGTIYTNLIKIMSEGGNISIVGNTITVKDSDGTVRVQIGEDGQGDYNLYLCDAAGKLLWNATGVTEDGLNDGIIKDAAVAEDANISGSKLNIASVAEKLNEDGSLIVDSSKVKIDNSTLDVVYTTLKNTVSDQGESLEALQTEFEVVQGKVESKIWQTDIDTAVDAVNDDIIELQEQYSAVTQTVDGISTKVGDLEMETDSNTQNILDLEERVTNVEVNADGIAVRVSSTETKLDTLEENTADYQSQSTQFIEDLNEQLQTLQKSVEAKVDDESVSIAIQSALSDGVTKVVTETGIVVDQDGITVAKSNSDMSTNINENGMVVSCEDEEVLTANNTGVNAMNLTARQYLIVGTHSRFEDYGTGRTGCFWLN